jgi:hypothetical protein
MTAAPTPSCLPWPKLQSSSSEYDQ